MRVGLFLGAGASVFAGQPATKEIMDRVRDRVRERKTGPYEDEKRRDYAASIVADPVYSDVEKLYDGIERVIATDDPNCRPIIDNAGDGRHGMSHEEIMDEMNSLRSIIREVLLESFVVDPGVRKSIKMMYDMVLGVMRDHTDGTDDFQVFTTNYDTVVEEYCEEKGIPHGKRLRAIPPPERGLGRQMDSQLARGRLSPRNRARNVSDFSNPRTMKWGIRPHTSPGSPCT